ncbi:MAG: DUF4097 family beta strand repeat protein [Planctomycetes bacterium]|nr:DUF4097 family beta strand repeat protein [Planctomycetota bacterium]
MFGHSRCLLFGLGAVLGVTSGCSHYGPKVWTESVLETRSVDAATLRAVEVATHNGSVRYQGQAPPPAMAQITVTRRAGGVTVDDAQAAMRAIDVFVEPDAAGACKVGWRWRGVRQHTWAAVVSFDIVGPAAIRLDAETHNGEVRVDGVDGATSLTTHNGAVDVASRGASLTAVTHNGRINARYAGPMLSLETHNGGVTADISACGTVGGAVTTHNGTVSLLVSERTSTDVVCATHNGRVTAEPPVVVTSSTRTSLEGRLGEGGTSLSVVTHNGDVHVRRP